MREQLLTARELYRFLNIGVGTVSSPIPMIHQHLHFTQSDFWWCFFSAGLPEDVIRRYFYTGDGRSRSLSNLMNRTVPHAMPSVLYRAMETHLNPDSILHTAIWLSSPMDENLNPVLIHRALSELEDRIYAAGSDVEFCELYSFFTSLRPPDTEPPSPKLYMHSVLRFTMLAFHAIYGDRMVSSPALSRIRSCHLWEPECFWQATLSTAPRIRENGFSFLRAVKALKETPDAEQTGCGKDRDPVEAISALAREALGSIPSQPGLPGEQAGLYVVANWMDMCVNVNDAPRSTYEGAGELGTLPNGTLLYVLSAPGYQGLHVSSGVWGKIIWHEGTAWVPMNLLIHLKDSEA